MFTIQLLWASSSSEFSWRSPDPVRVQLKMEISCFILFAKFAPLPLPAIPSLMSNAPWAVVGEGGGRFLHNELEKAKIFQLSILGFRGRNCSFSSGGGVVKRPPHTAGRVNIIFEIKYYLFDFRFLFLLIFPQQCVVCRRKNWCPNIIDW